ncbi:MAG TPA: hypothetical protein VGG29_20780 [Caulobacteraceae bacterium]
MSLPADVIEQATADKDGRRLAARLFAQLGLADGALSIPRLEAELAVAMALSAGADIEAAHHMGERHCRVCGCTQLTACRGPDGPCAWVPGEDLCTVCAAFPEPV